MRFLTAEEIAAQYPPPPSADKLRLADRNLLSPLEKLLLIINDDERDIDEVLSACRYALPYCHAVKQTDEIVVPPLGHLKDAASILAAQRRVAKAVEAGTLPVDVGRDLISTLAVMLKSYEAVALEDRLELVEAELNNRRIVGDHPQLLVIDGGAPPNGDD
jgi:hypothetical protein